MNRLAIFDCDGTLVDGQANICLAMERAFDDHRLPPPDRHAIRRIVGLSVPDAVAQLAPTLDVRRHLAVAEDFKRHFQAMRSNGGLLDEPLFEGIAEGLARLASAGWRLGVATGKSDRGLRMVLEHHGLAGHFLTLQTADRHPSKPHPSMVLTAMREAGATPDATVMIGDTSYDMAMAVAAGAHPVGVGWGYHEPHELADAGAVFVAAHATALFNYLEAR
ncbi:haloacid dehalogenase [Brasilonema bromeliae SPC951]|uniref:Haloacid dehalogenase n=1 Tax=Brasilonema bromeliae SPC951 TaxID=385972 RepID=A0ABX1PFP8_9CYAN|nr:HAD-IA family hydrolase [Brasilonema bromeliae]NMG22567.1 haloacid dehalogenase [Brasilonema bromeliae SPC951]